MRVKLSVISGALLASSAVAQVTQQAAAPVAEPHVRVDTLHGEVRRDAYYWLREKSDPAVRSYLEADNAYAEKVLAQLGPLREQLYDEMLSRIKQTDLSGPYRLGDYFYYTRTVEGQQ